ncbi:MAG: DUF493 family protein [Proteobacteria bacterium]|nr:MAG: DUF493 family protein [Pseudomonadota bacterium]
MDQDDQKFRDLLDSHHRWPSIYTFKFIVPVASGKELEALIPEAEQVESRPSSGGKYTAYTFYCPMGSGREVLEVYARVQGVAGLISL